MSLGGPGEGWRPSVALRRALWLIAGLIVGGVVVGKPVLLVFAAGVVTATVLALANPLTKSQPDQEATQIPSVAATVDATAIQGREVTYQVKTEGCHGAQIAVMHVPTAERFPLGDFEAIPVRAGVSRLSRELSLDDWGEAETLRPAVVLSGCDGLFVRGPLGSECVVPLVIPTADQMGQGALAPRSAGLVGQHPTRRPGEGSDLLDVREFRPGDKTRRIDWRVSARRGELFVRRTAVDSDADVVLCLDSRMDLGPQVGQWHQRQDRRQVNDPRPSSLDVSVRAVVSLTETFLRQGDRVALVDLAHQERVIPSGHGRRHLQRIHHHAARTTVQPHRRSLEWSASTLMPGTVLLISPMLDAEIADFALRLGHRRRHVLVIDTMPLSLSHEGASASEQVALRLLWAERRHRLHTLEGAGISVVHWESGNVPQRLFHYLRRPGRAAS